MIKGFGDTNSLFLFFNFLNFQVLTFVDSVGDIEVIRAIAFIGKVDDTCYNHLIILRHHSFCLAVALNRILCIFFFAPDGVRIHRKAHFFVDTFFYLFRTPARKSVGIEALIFRLIEIIWKINDSWLVGPSIRVVRIHGFFQKLTYYWIFFI